jgi:flagellar hook-basal body complex protein FliE
MINGPDINLAAKIANPAAPRTIGAPPVSEGGSSFADVFNNSINEVTRLQQDASQAVQDLATGKTENVTGVFTAMEKSEMAFKTLLAIRAKLMDAYEEIKSIQV